MIIDKKLGQKYILDESDKKILDILGRNCPVIEGLPTPEPSGDSSSIIIENIQLNSIIEDLPENTVPQKKRFRMETNFEKSKKNLENKILEIKLKTYELDYYFKVLEVFQKERELKLPPSSFTKHLYEKNNSSEIPDNLSDCIRQILDD